MLESVRQRLTLLHGKALELERRGFSGSELTELKKEAVKLSGEIELLEAIRRSTDKA
jgi:hypothetical protein